MALIGNYEDPTGLSPQDDITEAYLYWSQLSINQDSKTIYCVFNVYRRKDCHDNVRRWVDQIPVTISGQDYDNFVKVFPQEVLTINKLVYDFAKTLPQFQNLSEAT